LDNTVAKIAFRVLRLALSAHRSAMAGMPSLDTFERQNARIDVGETFTKLVHDLGKVKLRVKFDQR
jgi:hypothetical protein